MLYYIAPAVGVSITESQNPTALRSYILTCDVTAPPTLDLTTISYTWMRNTIVVQSGQTNQVVFNSLSLSEDNTVYKCQYRASSVYLNNNVDVTSPGHTIRITSMWI